MYVAAVRSNRFQAIVAEDRRCPRAEHHGTPGKLRTRFGGLVGFRWCVDDAERRVESAQAVGGTWVGDQRRIYVREVFGYMRN